MGGQYNLEPYPDQPSNANWAVVIPSRVRPAPKPAGLTIHEQVQIRRENLRKGLRWAMFTVVPCGIFFSFSGGTAFTQLTQLTGLTDFWFAVLTTSLPLAASLMQIPTSVFLQRHVEKRKSLMLWSGTIHRLLYAVMAAVPLLFGAGPLAAFLLIAFMGVSQGLGNVGGLCWQNWMADLIPPRRRGKFFGRRVMFNCLTMLVAGLILAYCLPKDTNVPNAGWILFIVFLIAAVCGAADFLGFIFVPDFAVPSTTRNPWLADLLKPWRDPTFRPFLYFAMLIAAGNCFVGVYMYKQMLYVLHVDPFKTMLALQIVPWATIMLTGPVWGRCLDRIGRKPTLLVGTVGGTLLTLSWFFVTGDLWWISLITYAFASPLFSAAEQTHFNFLLKFSTHGGSGASTGSRSSYAATFSVSVSLVGVIASVLGGWVANSLDQSRWVTQVQQTLAPWHLEFSPYLLLLAGFIVLRLLAAVWLQPRIQEPGSPGALKSVKLVGQVIFDSLSEIPSPWTNRAAKPRDEPKRP